MNPRDLLSRNLGLFAKMKELATRQRELLSNDQVEAFLRLITEREKLQYEISSNEKRYRQRARVGPTAKTHAVARDIMDWIHSIQETDREIEELLAEKKDQILMDAKALRRGQHALRGYGGKAPKAPRFIDKEG